MVLFADGGFAVFCVLFSLYPKQVRVWGFVEGRGVTHVMHGLSRVTIV